VSDRNFRRDLNRIFEDMTGRPSPALRDRIRASVAQAPEARGPYWIAAVAACLIAALIVGVFVVANPLNRRPTPIGSTVRTPSPTATAPPTPVSTLPSFICASSTLSGQGTQPVVYVSGLNTGTHQGYDRLVIDFSSGQPNGTIELKPQAGTTFTQSPSGQPVTLRGKNGVLVVIHGADIHSSYNAPRDVSTTYFTMAEVRVVEDFEGTVQLAIGTTGAACYRAFWLSNPERLVVDVQAA